MTNHWAHSGYDTRNIDSLDKKYKCLICRQILKDTVQLICGHRLCRLCYSYDESEIQCPECLEITLTSKIQRDNGFDHDMQTLPIICSSCEWSGQLKNYQAHLEQSHNQYKCSYCNETLSSLTLFNEHTATTCPQMPMNCILQTYGCKERVLRCNLSKHYLSEVHQQIILLYIIQLLLTLSEDNQKLALYGIDVERTTIDLLSTVTTTAAATTALIADPYMTEQKYVKEMMDTISGGIEVLNDDLQRLSNESLQQTEQMETTSQNLQILKTSFEESNASLNAHIINMDILQEECHSLQQNAIERQSISMDGTLIWKITDVNEKMMNAQSERQTSIYSPPFYSSPTGYKMRARLYLYGDGNARRTHMSLFFVLMRSDNDALLQFPFKYKVTFCLFDQTTQQRHIIDSFRPDIKSNSFQKPRYHMNIASGIPKFVPLSIIEQNDNLFVKNDTMFIKIMVDFENLPRTILPYAFSLNPGMPTHCQQKLIHQEIERQAQLQSHQITQTNP